MDEDSNSMENMNDDTHETQVTRASSPSFSMSDLPDLRDNPGEENEDIAKNRAEFTTVYDVIDQLEAQLEEAKGSMFQPGIVKIDRDDFTEKLENLKNMLPVQLERASALMRESEHRLESAQTQANVIITSAQSRAEDMVREANEQARIAAGRENITELAREKARGILDKAQAKADKLTQGADDYCINVMESLDEQVQKLTHDLQGGLHVLKERQKEARADLPHLSPDDYPKQ